MTIVGVFKDVSDAERQYLFTSGMWIYDDKDLYDDRYAISAAITNRYSKDENCYGNVTDIRQYTIYFDSYSNMMDFYKEVKDKDIEGVMYTPPMVEGWMETVYGTMNSVVVSINDHKPGVLYSDETSTFVRPVTVTVVPSTV